MKTRIIVGVAATVTAGLVAAAYLFSVSAKPFTIYYDQTLNGVVTQKIVRHVAGNGEWCEERELFDESAVKKEVRFAGTRAKGVVAIKNDRLQYAGTFAPPLDTARLKTDKSFVGMESFLGYEVVKLRICNPNAKEECTTVLHAPALLNQVLRITFSDGLDLMATKVEFGDVTCTVPELPVSK